MRFLSGVSLTTNNLATQPTEPVYAITTVGSEISSGHSHSTENETGFENQSVSATNVVGGYMKVHVARPAEVNLVPRALFPGFGAP